MLLDAALASSPQPQSTSTSTPASSAQPTATPTPVHAHPSPLDPPPPQTAPHAPPPGHSHSHSRSHSQPQADAGNGPAAPHVHTNGHASSLAAPPHGHPHGHGHGHAHAYPANHGPSTRAPGSSAHGIPNEVRNNERFFCDDRAYACLFATPKNKMIQRRLTLLFFDRAVARRTQALNDDHRLSSLSPPTPTSAHEQIHSKWLLCALLLPPRACL